jgi:outer membrane scaffolding protein for murein synthesis (MipA/OmpV family)
MTLPGLHRTDRILLTGVLALCAALVSTGAFAQGAPPTGWSTELGVGAIVNPEYQGSGDYQIRPIPVVDVRWRDARGTRLFANVPRGVGGYLWRSSGDPLRRTAVGLAIAPGFATRDDEIDGLEEIDIATEARAYLEYGRGGWAADVTLAADLGTGHEGAYADVSLQRRGRIGSGGFWSLGPSLRIADADYNGAQYGVSPAESVRSGLAPFDADAGLEQVSLVGVVGLPVGERWRWTTVARLGRIVGDRADSPVVEQETQAFVLTALTRTF